MNTKLTKIQALKVAAPYYGDLSHPTRGLSNLYFMLEIDPAQQQVGQVHVTVWNPTDDAELGSWLQQEGVQALFCNSIENCHQQNLSRTGIRIESITGTDVIKEIKCWLTDTGQSLLKPVNTGQMLA